MPALKLFSHRLCPYVQRARIVLGEKSIDHDLAFIDLANKPDWFLAISPLGKVPVLLVDDRLRTFLARSHSHLSTRLRTARVA